MCFKQLVSRLTTLFSKIVYFSKKSKKIYFGNEKNSMNSRFEIFYEKIVFLVIFLFSVHSNFYDVKF